MYVGVIEREPPEQGLSLVKYFLFSLFTRIYTAPTGPLRIKTTHYSMSPKRDFKFSKSLKFAASWLTLRLSLLSVLLPVKRAVTSGTRDFRLQFFFQKTIRRPQNSLFVYVLQRKRARAKQNPFVISYGSS